MLRLFISSLSIKKAVPTLTVPTKPVFLSTSGQSNHNGNFGSSNIVQLTSLRPDLIGPLGNGNVYSFKYTGLPTEFNYGNWDDDLQTGDPNWGYSGTVRTAAAFHCSFYDELYKAWGIPIYTVLHGRDATRLYQDAGSTDWNINSVGEHHDDYIARIDSAIAWMEANIGVQGTDWYYGGEIWFQGESDSNSPYKEAYEQNEIDRINYFRTRYGSKLLHVSIGVYVSSVPGYTDVNAAKVSNANKNVRNFYTQTVGLAQGDGIHFTTASQVQIGINAAAIVKQNASLFI